MAARTAKTGFPAAQCYTVRNISLKKILRAHSAPFPPRPLRCDKPQIAKPARGGILRRMSALSNSRQGDERYYHPDASATCGPFDPAARVIEAPVLIEGERGQAVENPPWLRE